MHPLTKSPEPRSGVMELTSQKNEEPEVNQLGATFVRTRFVWTERSSGGCAVGYSARALRDLSAAQERVQKLPGQTWDRWRNLPLSPRQPQRPLRWNGATPGRALHPRPRSMCCHQRTGSSGYCHPSARIWVARSAGWVLKQIHLPVPCGIVHGNRRAHCRTTASLHGLA